MGVRLHEPGVFSTASVGRLYLTHYRVLTTISTQEKVGADYQAHCSELDQRVPVLTSCEHPALPMPSVEVRRFWRDSMREGYGVEAIAVISRGFVGLAAAAITNLLEHLVDPGLGIPFRVFSKSTAAIAWLSTFDLEAREAEIATELETLRELP